MRYVFVVLRKQVLLLGNVNGWRWLVPLPIGFWIPWLTLQAGFNPSTIQILARGEILVLMTTPSQLKPC